LKKNQKHFLKKNLIKIILKMIKKIKNLTKSIKAKRDVKILFKLKMKKNQRRHWMFNN